MPQPNKIPLAFAASGDKNAIPESTETTGLASWRDGFPAITSEPFSQGGVAPKRADFNGIFNALSLAIVWQQQGGFYAYDATTDYEVGNVVEYSGDLYKCLVANGPNSAVKAPTDTTVWDAIATASGYLPRSGGKLSDGTNSLLLKNGTIELSASLPFIDFHHANSTVDHTARIINDLDGRLVISVQNDTNTQSKNLNLNIDGTLTWDGKDVATIQTGAWTPTLAGETTVGALNYSTQVGTYVKVGRIVAIMAKLVVSGITTQPTGYSLLKGLPYVISGTAVIPTRGQGGQGGCARKLIHASQNSDGSNVLRLQGVNPSSISSTGQIENLRWNSSDSSADYLMFASTAPMFEFNICGCYLTSS